MTWLWAYDATQEYGIEADIRNLEEIDDWPTHLSKPLKGFPVIDIEIERCNGPLPDFFNVGPFRIVSARLMAVVERCGGHAQFLPASIDWAGALGPYFYMHVLDELPCMDKKHSEFTIEQGFIDEIRRFVLDESVANQRPMFRLKKSYSTPLFVSDELADAIKSAKIAGVLLVPPNTFKNC